MLVDPADEVILLPAATRYETPGGVTETSTERRIIFSPEVKGRRIGEARAEWEVFLDLARRVAPDLAERSPTPTPRSVRRGDRSGRPAVCGDRDAERGRRLRPVRRAAPVRRLELPDARRQGALLPGAAAGRRGADGSFVCTTRRGKQFNSMVHEKATR